MKKAIAILLSLTMILGLAACGNSASQTEQPSTEDTSVESKADTESAENGTDMENTDNQDVQNHKALVAYFSATGTTKGVAVAYEELEESKEALEELETSFKCLWDDVRGKETPCYLKEEITPLKIADYAINLACEAVQTAAMLMKYEMSLNPATEREGE